MVLGVDSEIFRRFGGRFRSGPKGEATQQTTFLSPITDDLRLPQRTPHTSTKTTTYNPQIIYLMFTLNKYTRKFKRAVGTTTEALALPFRRARPASTKHPSSKPARRPTLQTDYVRLLQARNDNPTSDAMDIGKADGVRTLDDAFDPPHIANDVASDQVSDGS